MGVVMKLPSRRASAPELPGLSGKARVERRAGSLTARLTPGDVVVVHRPDLDAASARALLDHEVAAVVNSAPFVTGSYPTLGPQLLADAGVLLLEASPEQVAAIRDGATVRIHEGAVHGEDGELLRARQLGPDDIARARDQARDGLGRQLEAFAHNSSEFLRREQDLLLNGEGLPHLRARIAGRPVVVVARGPRHDAELDALREFVREQHPVLVAVDGGARALLRHRMRPDVVVVSAALVGTDDDDALPEQVLRGARELVVHERRSERTAGTERLQRWGIGAPRITSDADPFDLALLLAHAEGASLIVPVGRDAGFEEFLDRARSSQASSFLTRLRVGQRLVDSSAVPRLYSGRVRTWHLVLILVVALVALWLAMATTPIGNVWWHGVGDWINARLDDLKGLFS
jgi:uncharacterized membrane-anchored protein